MLALATVVVLAVVAFVMMSATAYALYSYRLQRSSNLTYLSQGGTTTLANRRRGLFSSPMLKRNDFLAES
jgi:hypothetical protein